MTFALNCNLLPMTHATALEALEEITAGRDIRVFGFGEIHSLNDCMGGLPTTLERFTPLFSSLVERRGVRYCGVEMLSEDLNEGFRDYLKTGHLGPLSDLGRALSPRERGQFLDFFSEARRLFASGHLEDFACLGPREEEAAMNFVFCGGLQESIECINGNVIQLAEKALKKGARVAFYNGMDHTLFERPPIGGYPNVCYVPALLDRFQMGIEHYLAVRLIVPEVTSNDWTRQVLPEYAELGDCAPLSGVHLRKDNEQAYTIIYSREGV